MAVLEALSVDVEDAHPGALLIFNGHTPLLTCPELTIEVFEHRTQQDNGPRPGFIRAGQLCAFLVGAVHTVMDVEEVSRQGALSEASQAGVRPLSATSAEQSAGGVRQQPDPAFGSTGYCNRHNCRRLGTSSRMAYAFLIADHEPLGVGT